MTLSYNSREHPNSQGAGRDTISKQGTPGFLLLLKELHARLIGERPILTVAIFFTPGSDPSDKPPDISSFAEQLACISAMNYDLWGYWSPVTSHWTQRRSQGRHLRASTVPTGGQSVASAVQALTSASLPGGENIMPLSTLWLGSDTSSLGEQFNHCSLIAVKQWDNKLTA